MSWKRRGGSLFCHSVNCRGDVIVRRRVRDKRGQRGDSLLVPFCPGKLRGDEKPDDESRAKSGCQRRRRDDRASHSGNSAPPADRTRARQTAIQPHRPAEPGLDNREIAQALCPPRRSAKSYCGKRDPRFCTEFQFAVDFGPKSRYMDTLQVVECTYVVLPSRVRGCDQALHTK